MFLILQDESFSKGKKGPKRKYNEGSTRYILGTKVRSKTGCLTCRKKKRKCDEHYPECDYCNLKGLHCSYLDDAREKTVEKNIVKQEEPDEDAGNDHKKRKQDLPSTVPLELSNNRDFIKPRMDNNIDKIFNNNDAGVWKDNHANDTNFQVDYKVLLESFSQVPDNSEMSYKIQDLKDVSTSESSDDVNENHKVNEQFKQLIEKIKQLDDNVDKFTTINKAQYTNEILEILDVLPSPYIITPSSLPSLYLDQKGIGYLEYYSSKVAIVLSISPDFSNHYLKSFYDLALNEESFMYAVTSWGSIYRGEEYEAKYYLKRAISKFNKSFNRYDPQTIYFRLSFLTILFTYYVCLGHNNTWYKFYLECCNLIRDNGGLIEVCKMCNFSNGMRFIMSSLQYSDIVSSKSHTYGCFFSSNEYYELFNNSPFKDKELSYGVDTLQGISQSMILIFGEIIELKLKINHIYSSLNQVDDYQQYNDMKLKFFNEVNQQIKDLEHKINNCQPNYDLLNLMEPNLQQYDLSKLTFESYKYVCLLYFNLYVKRISPDNIENQFLVQELFKIVDIFSNTKFCVISCIPLILCGVCCVNKFDKEILEQKINKAKMTSPVQNMEQAWIVIQKCWDLNPNGNLIVDWSDVCEELGWCLSVC